MDICKRLESKFPCRSEIIKTLCDILGNAEETFPPAIYLHGHAGTGKTVIVNQFVRWLARSRSGKTLRTAFINCVECYNSKILLESLLDELVSSECDVIRCENLKEFIEALRKLAGDYVIVLDNAEQLRDMEASLLPCLLRLPELCGLNVCVVLISQLPFGKFHNKTGLAEVISIHCPQYTKSNTLRILGADYRHTLHFLRLQLNAVNESVAQLDQKLQLLDKVTQDFFNNYLNLFLSVFYKACRELPELKITARKCFAVYMRPILDGSIEATDVSRLWRYIAPQLKIALSQVYMRVGVNQSKGDEVQGHNSLFNAHFPVGVIQPEHGQAGRHSAQTLELPYFAKYLLIAAFLASYNSAKEDKRFFVKHHGKQRKRMQNIKAKAKLTEKASTSLGPKSFSIDRLLAIFYAILDEKVGLTCNLLSQISTLVHLQLLTFVFGEGNVMDGSSRLQCTVNLDYVFGIGQVVGFNVRQYLSDFH